MGTHYCSARSLPAAERELLQDFVRPRSCCYRCGPKKNVSVPQQTGQTFDILMPSPTNSLAGHTRTSTHTLRRAARSVQICAEGGPGGSISGGMKKCGVTTVVLRCFVFSRSTLDVRTLPHNHAAEELWGDTRSAVFTCVGVLRGRRKIERRFLRKLMCNIVALFRFSLLRPFRASRFPTSESEHTFCRLSDRATRKGAAECRQEKLAITGELQEKGGREEGARAKTMLATAARRCPGAKTAARRAAGATRCKSAVAATSDNVKNFKIYRWDPNEKV